MCCMARYSLQGSSCHADLVNRRIKKRTVVGNYLICSRESLLASLAAYRRLRKERGPHRGLSLVKLRPWL